MSPDFDINSLIEQKSQAKLDDTSFCVVRFNMDCCYVYVNSATTRLFGLPAEYFIGKHISKTGAFGDEAQVTKLEGAIKRVFASGDATSCEARWMTSTGEHPFEIIHMPERDEEGQVTGVIGIAKLKADEQLLEENESFLRTLPDAIPLPIFYKDRQGRYLGFNRAYEDFFGAFRNQLVGKSVFDISPRNLAEIYYAKDNELFENGGIQRYESQVRNTKGELRDVIFNKAVFTDSKGNIKGLIGAILDITERKQMEYALKELNRELRAVSRCHQTLLRADDEQELLDEICRIIVGEAAYRMVWVGYVEHDEARSIRPVSWAGFDSGYIADAALTWTKDLPHGQGPSGLAVRSGDIIYVRDVATDPRMAPWRDQALQRGYRSCIAVPLRSKDEQVFGVLSIYASEVDAISTDEMRLLIELTDDLAFGISVLRNQSKRQRAEEEREKLQAQLLQVQKMDAIGRLAGGISHDFNNMLGAIIGYLDLAVQQLNPKQRAHFYLQEARKAADRSVDLTRQLLTFARKQSVSPKALDLNAAVEGMLNMLSRLIGEDVHLDWLPGGEIWPVRLDPSQADQILANLCVNARDAIDGIGRITIQTTNAHLDESDCAGHPEFIPGDYLCLSVGDDGCGMNEDVLRTLFEPFFSTKGQGKGTGLGLATVYGIVKQNGGFIGIDTEPGNGSMFHVYLPRHLGMVEDDVREDGPEECQSHGQETILLVEDEPAMLDMIRSILSKRGFHVLAASSPTQAITLATEHAKASNIDLLITDMVMPDMNGQDLSEIILRLFPDIKLLFMSGYLDDYNFDPSNNLILKPFATKALFSKIIDVLNGENGRLK